MSVDAELIKINTILLKHLRTFSTLGYDKDTLTFVPDNTKLSFEILPEPKAKLPEQQKEFLGYNVAPLSIMRKSFAEILLQENKILRHIKDLIYVLELKDFNLIFNSAERAFIAVLLADAQEYREKQFSAMQKLNTVVIESASSDDILQAIKETYSEDFMDASLKFAQATRKIAFFEGMLRIPYYKEYMRNVLEKKPQGKNCIIDILLARDKMSGSQLTLHFGPQGLVRRGMLISEQVYMRISNSHPDTVNVARILKKALQINEYINQAIGNGLDIAAALSISLKDSKFLTESMNETVLLAEIQERYDDIQKYLFWLPQINFYLTSEFFSYRKAKPEEQTVFNFKKLLVEMALFLGSDLSNEKLVKTEEPSELASIAFFLVLKIIGKIEVILGKTKSAEFAAKPSAPPDNSLSLVFDGDEGKENIISNVGSCSGRKIFAGLADLENDDWDTVESSGKDPQEESIIIAEDEVVLVNVPSGEKCQAEKPDPLTGKSVLLEDGEELHITVEANETNHVEKLPPTCSINPNTMWKKGIYQKQDSSIPIPPIAKINLR